MTEYSRIFFTLLFTDMFDMDMLDSYVQDGFLGIGDATRTDDPRVLEFRPYRSIGYLEVKKTLDGFQEDGALTYTERRDP